MQSLFLHLKQGIFQHIFLADNPGVNRQQAEAKIEGAPLRFFFPKNITEATPIG